MNGRSSARFASGDEQLSAGGEGHGHGGRSSERFAAGDQQLAAGGEGRGGEGLTWAVSQVSLG